MSEEKAGVAKDQDELASVIQSHLDDEAKHNKELKDSDMKSLREFRAKAAEMAIKFTERLARVRYDLSAGEISCWFGKISSWIFPDLKKRPVVLVTYTHKKTVYTIKFSLSGSDNAILQDLLWTHEPSMDH